MRLIGSIKVKLKQAQGDNRTRKLIKLGIALHTYADTWAHQNFSGIFNPTNNAVAGLELFINGGWQKKDVDTLPSIVPETGHAKAHCFPDCSHSRWRYYNGVTRENFERDNPRIFLDAAGKIYDLLCAASGSPNRWEKCLERVNDCISFDSGLPLDDTIGKKCEHYKKVFQDITFSYDEHEWKEKALTAYDSSSNTISFRSKALDQRNKHERILDSFASLASFKSPEDALKDALNLNITYRFNQNTAGNLKWFYFHLEALKQREFVKERVPVGDIKDGQFNDGQLGRVATNTAEKLLNSWSLTAAATRLEGKSRWMLIEIENQTPYPIVWRGSHDGDFDLSGAHGRYWDRPSDIAGFSKGGFSACEKDQEPTGCGAVVPFSIILSNGEQMPFSIGISNPLVSGISFRGVGKLLDSLTTHKVKCRATFDSDRHRVWENLDDDYEEDNSDFKQISDNVRLHLSCMPNQKAKVVLRQA